MYEYATVYLFLHPDGLMVVSTVCIMNGAAMDILFSIFRCICARVFLEYVDILKNYASSIYLV